MDYQKIEAIPKKNKGAWYSDAPVLYQTEMFYG